LISNAVKYGDTDAEIGIRLSQTDSEFEFAVSNRGPGIRAEELPQLFERFSRSETSRQVPGLGLGLYIARGLVNAHGGQIRAESIPGETTTFFFTIPSLPNVTSSKEHVDTVPV
jgi:signal transduction histidine kinase